MVFRDKHNQSFLFDHFRRVLDPLPYAWPKEHYESMNFHGLHIAGWYDIFLKGTIENYVGLKKASDKHQMLVIGPWYHMPWSQYVGEVDFGKDAMNNIDILQVRFFDRWLNNIENNIITILIKINVFFLPLNNWYYKNMNICIFTLHVHMY